MLLSLGNENIETLTKSENKKKHEFLQLSRDTLHVFALLDILEAEVLNFRISTSASFWCGTCSSACYHSINLHPNDVIMSRTSMSELSVTMWSVFELSQVYSCYILNWQAKLFIGNAVFGELAKTYTNKRNCSWRQRVSFCILYFKNINRHDFVHLSFLTFILSLAQNSLFMFLIYVFIKQNKKDTYYYFRCGKRKYFKRNRDKKKDMCGWFRLKRRSLKFIYANNVFPKSTNFTASYSKSLTFEFVNT